MLCIVDAKRPDKYDETLLWSRLDPDRHPLKGPVSCKTKSSENKRSPISEFFNSLGYKTDMISKEISFLPILVFVFAVLIASSLQAQDISGIPQITDGDTIKIAGQRIRLHGIDAPEARQTCHRAGEKYACGSEATKALTALIDGQSVTCRTVDIDRYKRIVAKCYLGRRDINEWMVREGWAVAYRKYSTDYVAVEEAARVFKVGLWAGEFMRPWEWRRKRR